MRAITVCGAVALLAGCSTLDFDKFRLSMDGGADTAIADASGDLGDMDDGILPDSAADAGPGREACDGVDNDGDGDVDETTLEDGLCEDANPECPGTSCACAGGECRDAPEEISAGGLHTCVRMTSGQVYCWGSNSQGQSGGDMSIEETPTLVTRGAGERLGATSLSAALEHTCAIDDRSRAVCWGSNDSNRAGTEAMDTTNQALEVVDEFTTMSFPAEVVSAGERFTIVSAEGSFHSAGDNGSSQHGNNTTTSVMYGTRTYEHSLAAFEEISSGSLHSCGISGGRAYCWGDNGRGQTAAAGASRTPSLVPGGDFVHVAAGSFHSCGIAMDGGVRCWGGNDALQLGRAGSDDGVPGLVADAGTGALVTAGGAHTCIVDDAGDVLCWGENSSGQLGVDPATTSRSATPVPVDVGDRSLAISAGGLHTCVITAKRVIVCWGSNAQSQSGAANTGEPWVAPQTVRLVSGGR